MDGTKVSPFFQSWPLNSPPACTSQEEETAVWIPIEITTQDDGRLVDCVLRALSQAGYSELSGVAVASRASLVVLSGYVPSHYLKQLAQYTALAVPGIQEVRNQLVVGRPN